MSTSGEKPSEAAEDRIGYSERRISSIKELKTLVWGLDLDEGIRFVADLPGHKDGAFVFLTRCDDKFCVSIKERRYDEGLKEYVPAGKEQWKYFETAESLWNYATKLLKLPLEAYYY